MPPAGRRPPPPGDNTSSAVLPILIALLALGLVVAIVKTTRLTARDHAASKAQNAQIATLNATDKVACTFIVSDASTRSQQAVNANLTVKAQRNHIRLTKRILALFDSPATRRAAVRQTKAQRATTLLFENYLRSDLNLTQTAVTQSVKNILLTRTLAATATTLAATLPCPAPSGGR